MDSYKKLFQSFNNSKHFTIQAQIRSCCDRQLKNLRIPNTVHLETWKLNHYCISGKKESEDIKTTVDNDASHKSLWQIVDEQLKGAGRKSWPMKMCVCVCTRASVFFYKVRPCYMYLFRSYVPLRLQATPTATPLLPVGPDSQIVYQLSFGSWPTFPLNHVQVF